MGVGNQAGRGSFPRACKVLRETTLRYSYQLFILPPIERQDDLPQPRSHSSNARVTEIALATVARRHRRTEADR
jgi:hypothetical protein